MILMLRNHYGKKLVLMNIEGCASLLCLKKFVPYNLKLTQDQSDEEIQMNKLIHQIKTEATSLPKQTDYDLLSSNLSQTVDNTSSTLLSLVSKLVLKGKTSKASLSLAQSIQSHITKSSNQTTMGLAVKFLHKFGSREANDMLHEYGYAASYDEVVRFRNSAAKFIGEQGFSAMGLRVNSGPISVWCDNYDLNIYTPNGSRETHAMDVEFTQQAPQDDRQTEPKVATIPRLSKAEQTHLKLSELSSVNFTHYQGPNNPMPPNIIVNIGQSWEDVVKN